MSLAIKTIFEPTAECLQGTWFLHSEFFPVSSWSEEYLKKFFSKQERLPILCVLEKDGLVQGFVLGRMQKEKNEFLIHSFLVSENLRGQGYGKKLMIKMLETVVKYTKAQSVAVRFREKNPVRKFYEALGFGELQECGFYNNGEQKIALCIKRENIK